MDPFKGEKSACWPLKDGPFRRKCYVTLQGQPRAEGLGTVHPRQAHFFVEGHFPFLRSLRGTVEDGAQCGPCHEGEAGTGSCG